MRCIVVVVILCMLHAVCGSVRIDKLEQKLDLRSHLATLTEVVSFKDATGSIVLCYPIQYCSNAAYVGFSFKSDASNQLKYSEVDVQQPGNYTCWSVDLGSRASGDLESTLVMANLQVPTPAVLMQGQDQIVTFSGATLAVSPHPVASQRLTVTLPSPDLKEHSRVSPVSAAGSRVTYGPYADTPPFPLEPLLLRYKSHAPFLRVVRLDRDITVSHWGRVNVEERYILQHAGANLTRRFSRLEYMAASFGGADDMPFISQLSFSLPRRAANLYFKDTIGNISSSNVRHQASKTVLLARPRYPLMGGWRTEFTIGYSLPLGEVVKRRQGGEGGYLLSFGFVPPIDQAYIADDVTTSIVVPEGSQRLNLFSGPAFDSVEHTSTYTYLDTFGRPTLKLHKRNVVKEHGEKVHVSYRFSNVYLLQEPFLITAAVFIIFAATMAISRVDLTIAKGAEWRAAQQREKEGDAMTTLAAVVATFNKHMATLAHSVESANPGDVDGALSKLDAAKAAAKSALDDMRSLQENLQGLSTAAAAAAASMCNSHAAWLSASERAHTSLVNGVGSGMSVADARKRLQEQLSGVEQLQADATAEATALLADS